MISDQGTTSPSFAQTEPIHLSTIYSMDLSLHELCELCRTACLFSKALCHHTYWSGISPCVSPAVFILQYVCRCVYIFLKYTAPFSSWWGICFLIVFAKSTIAPSFVILNNVLQKVRKGPAHEILSWIIQLQGLLITYSCFRCKGNSLIGVFAVSVILKF